MQRGIWLIAMPNCQITLPAICFIPQLDATLVGFAVVTIARRKDVNVLHSINHDP